MIQFPSLTQAQRKVQSIANSTNVHYTNDGFEILFTVYDSHEKINKIATDLTAYGFDNVVVKGKKIKTILVNWTSFKSENLRISEIIW